MSGFSANLSLVTDLQVQMSRPRPFKMEFVNPTGVDTSGQAKTNYAELPSSFCETIVERIVADVAVLAGAPTVRVKERRRSQPDSAVL